MSKQIIPTLETRKDRKGRDRHGWSCNGCGESAGMWPAKKSAAESADRHIPYCKANTEAVAA